MSDYEATAYLSLEKLKVKIIYYIFIIGETYVRILIVLREDKKRVIGKDEVF